MILGCFHLHAISFGGRVTALLFAAALVRLAMLGNALAAVSVVILLSPRASVVSFRILLVTEGGAAVCGGNEKGGLVSMSRGTSEGSVVSGVMLEIVAAGPPQFITHSCIVSKLFSFPEEIHYKVSYYTTYWWWYQMYLSWLVY